MKVRKTLELTFPDSFSATLFMWDNGRSVWGYEHTWEGNVLRIKVQPRRARAEIRAMSVRPYGAIARTLVR